MTISISTKPAVKAALIALLQARPGLSGVLVTWAIPHGTLEAEWICVGNVIGEDASAAIGQQARDERYTVACTVSVLRSMLEPAQATAERAFVLAGEIQSALRPLASTPLGVGQLVWALVTKTDLEEFADGKNREARVTVNVSCFARI